MFENVLGDVGCSSAVVLSSVDPDVGFQGLPDVVGLRVRMLYQHYKNIIYSIIFILLGDLLF